MYGLVNKAIEDLVCSRFGEECFETIKEKAGVDVDVFMCMQQYPDAITYQLISAASEVLGVEGEEILRSFGEYWVQYTAQAGYGELLKMAGRTLAEVLMNLDNLHTRVALTFPHLQPPSFWCSDVQPGSLRLHYRSVREGLAPLVIGLVTELGNTFKTPVEIVQTAQRAQGADHDEFLIHYRAAN